MLNNLTHHLAPAGTAQAVIPQAGHASDAQAAGVASCPTFTVAASTGSAFVFPALPQPAQVALPLNGLPVGLPVGLPMPTVHAQRLQSQLAQAPVAAPPAANTCSLLVSLDQWNALNKQLVDAQAQLAYAKQEKVSSEALWRQLVSTFKIKREDVLSAAAASGNYTAIIERNLPGVGLNRLDSAGVTPLHSAVQAGRADMVAFLLADRAIDPNIKCSRGFPPLAYALSSRNSEMVRALVADSRVDPNLPFGNPPMPPLTFALGQRDLQSAELLLSSGQLCLDRSAFGETGPAFDLVADRNGLPELAARIRAMVAATNTAALARVPQVVEPSVQSPSGDGVLDASPAFISRSPSFQHLLERIQTPPPPLMFPDA